MEASSQDEDVMLMQNIVHPFIAESEGPGELIRVHTCNTENRLHVF